MNKLFLIKNPLLFQGEKYLNKNKQYFEGWYFKNTKDKFGISFIPGISIDKENKTSFIQIITNESSYFINYDITCFETSYDPFYIKIGNNYFSKESIHIDINDLENNIKIYGDLKYKESKNISTDCFNPNIMGPFSYIPFMECNHAIISMSHKIEGFIEINNEKVDLRDGIEYIEKDWGCSFPKRYIWAQGNSFKDKTASFMLSIADIPFKLFHFRGLICSLIIGNDEYKFTTYNNAKIVKYDIDDERVDIVLQKGKYCLEMKSKYNSGLKLIAPVKGRMKKDILESISSVINMTLKKKDKVIFEDTTTNCGLEIVR